MFMVLSSWHRGARDECRTAPTFDRSLCNRPESQLTASAITIYYYSTRMAILISPSHGWQKATLTWVAGTLHTDMVYASTDGHPSQN